MTHSKHGAVGALDEGSFRRLLDLLQKLVTDQSESVTLWLEIRKEFRLIGENTANYIGYITSPEVDSRMKTETFLVYKDKFVNYLRDFIINVQNLYYQFQAVIEELPKINQEQLIDGLFEKEQEIPTMDQITREEVADVERAFSKNPSRVSRVGEGRERSWLVGRISIIKG